MSTGDAWSAMLADAVHNPHIARIEPPPSWVVYAFFICFVGWVLIAIFVAVMLDYFNDSNYEEGISVKFDDIASFQRKWLEFDPQGTSFMRTNDLGLLLFACKPPLVGVQLEQSEDTFSFFRSASSFKLVQPNLAQLETLVIELDVPDHNGSVHFLEVLLALLQRLTGVVHEERIMAQLLTVHPMYVESIKRMPAITGSTADEAVKISLMGHLRRGLQATGLLDELEGKASLQHEASFAKRSSSSMRSFSMRRSSAVCRTSSFGRTPSGADSEGGSPSEVARHRREREMRRSALSRCASTNNIAMQCGVLSAFGGTDSPLNRSFTSPTIGAGPFHASSPNASFTRRASGSSGTNSVDNSFNTQVLRSAGCYDDHLTA